MPRCNRIRSEEAELPYNALSGFVFDTFFHILLVNLTFTRNGFCGIIIMLHNLGLFIAVFYNTTGL